MQTNRKMGKGLIILILAGILFTSCEKQVDWDLQPAADTLLVVEGTITDELAYQTIWLSGSVKSANEDPIKISGAEVIVTVNGFVNLFREDSTSPGSYKSLTPFRGIPSNEHSLLITYNKQVFSAKSDMLKWNGNYGSNFYSLQQNSEGTYNVSWQTSAYNPGHAVMYELFFDWSDVEGYENASYGDTHARMFNYTLPTLDVSELFAPGTETVKIPGGATVTAKRYTLTEQHAAYIRALLLATSWQGGFFSSATANVPTNLSAGATGFFSACSVVSHSGVVK